MDVTISNVQIETAVPYESGLGIANFVEQCLCPKGYTGLSCEVSFDFLDKKLLVSRYFKI